VPNGWRDRRRNRDRWVVISVVAISAATLVCGCSSPLGSSAGSGRTLSGAAVVYSSPSGASSQTAPGSSSSAGSGTATGSSHSGGGSGTGNGTVTVSIKDFCKHVLAQFTIITDWAQTSSSQDPTKVYRDLYAEERAASTVAPAQLKSDIKVRLKILGAAASATSSGLSQATAAFNSPEYLAATVNEDNFVAANCGPIASPTP